MTATAILGTTTISQVFVALGGNEPKRGRARAFYRDGDNRQAVSLNDAKGCWYDHRDGVGGGMFDLIQRVLGCDRAAALRWLSNFTGLPLEDQPASRRSRRAFAERRREARIEAEMIGFWRDALMPELNARKIAAVDAGDDQALARAALLCNVLEHGSPEDVVGEYGRHRAADPAEVTRFVALGRARNDEARRITADVVLLLARAAESEDLDDAP
jgi:hypothetical protein